MLRVKATKTKRYAQANPGDPQYYLIEGNEYDLPDQLAHRIVELGGGKLIEMPVEKTPEDDSKVGPTETPEPVIDTKEKGRADSSKRTPGKPKR